MNTQHTERAASPERPPEETHIVRNRRIRNVVVAAALLISFAAGCGGPAVDSVIRSGSGDIVPAETAE